MLLAICYANTSSQWCDVCPLCRRHNIIHAVNITAAGNIICPWGQTSFSVNAPLRASRYPRGAFVWLQSSERTQSLCHRRNGGFAYPARRSTSSLVRRRGWVSSPSANTLVPTPHRVISLAENLHFDKSASIAFVWTNAKGLSPNPYYKQKEQE